MSASTQIARAREVFDIEIEGLRCTRDSLGETFSQAVDLFARTLENGGLVVVTGVGKNLHVAEKISAIFASTGTRSIVLNPVQAMHGDLGMTSSRDVLLALSFSGESEEVLRLVPAVRRHGLKVVSLTGNAESSLARISDIHVTVPCGKEACPFGMAPTNSTTATMALGDAFAMVLLDERKFDKESYALNHPAGAIGRALVLKVGDVMRTGEHAALVAPEATVLDALLAMTRAQSGAAAVVDAEGVLQGIFTDGDFRRIISSRSGSGDVLRDQISLYMTKKPLYIRDDAYAVDLLRVFEAKRIDDLPVCDASGRVVGMVDIQDLPKMKVL